MTYMIDWAYRRHQRGIRSWQRLSRMTTYLVKLPVTVEGITFVPESLKNEAAGYGSERAGDMAYGWLARVEGRSNLSKEEGRQKFLVSIDDCTSSIDLLSWLDTQLMTFLAMFAAAEGSSRSSTFASLLHPPFSGGAELWWLAPRATALEKLMMSQLFVRDPQVGALSSCLMSHQYLRCPLTAGW